MTELTIIGPGIMGQYVARALSDKANITFYHPNKPREVLEKALPNMNFRLENDLERAVRNADIVMFCVPTHLVYDSMTEALPYCKLGTLISGQTSRKTPEAEAFDKVGRSDLEMVTIHTMANPATTNDLSNEILGIIRHKASDKTYQWARDFYGSMSNHIEEFGNVEEHDIVTANTQINTSRTFLAIASAFAKAGCFPWIEYSYSSWLDIMKFSMAMRTASQPSHIYKGIQFGSQHGKQIVSAAIEIEDELDQIIVAGDRSLYRSQVMKARKKIYGNKFGNPILSDEEMAIFNATGHRKANSHISFIGWFVAEALSGRNPFENLKGTTPMHTSLLCMADYLFNNKDLLEESIAAPFELPSIKSDDLVYHDERRGWALALLYDVDRLYDEKHREMREVLDNKKHAPRVKEEVERSRKVAQVCREAMSTAIASGRIDELRAISVSLPKNSH